MDVRRIDRNRLKPVANNLKMKCMDKPMILRQLENSCEESCCLTIGQRVSSIEMIVFVFNVLKTKVTDDCQPICVKQLYLLVKEYMFKQMNAITEHQCLHCPQTEDNSKDQNDSEDKQKLCFNNFLNDFIESKILAINVQKQTISFCSDVLNDDTKDSFECLSRVKQMVDNCLICIFNNYLSHQLSTYGRRRVDDIEMRLIRSHNYLFQYLFSEKNNYRLLDFFESNPKQFVVEYPNEKTDAFVSINSVTSSDQLKTYLQFGPKAGQRVSGLIGLPFLSDPNNLFIGFKKTNIDLSTDFQFRIHSKLTLIYGQEVVAEQLFQWIHENDSVVFDAKLMANNQNMKRLSQKEWLVTSISRVRHYGQCYICVEHLFSGFQWHKYY